MSVEILEYNETREAERDERDSETQKLWQCDVCGMVMLDLHCKLRCVNCGFMRDCSDP